MTLHPLSSVGKSSKFEIVHCGVVDSETVNFDLILDLQIEILDHFLDPETDIMVERNYSEWSGLGLTRCLVPENS